ncbi:MAG TPA: tetratricopeptide repeat protein [Burkholderiales bacterium]|jgi:regulator of sirC expression with transglutaminase-like and TPR domain|nr:tetratricopeptide repeat protein [Burkholderiales bacterium]
METQPGLNPDRRWEEIVARQEEDIDLAEAALAIAAEEYRGLDIPHYLARIDEMAATLGQRLRRDITTTDTIIALNHYLFDELGFSGNAADYYDPRNSYLNEVLDRRLGIPITLSIVYVEVGRRVGLALRGVSFPGHFLVKCAVRNGTIVLDPYVRGASLGMDDLRQRIRAVQGEAVQASDDELRRMLAAAGKKDILARVLRNLKGIYRQKQQLERALSASMRIIALDPRAAEEYRDRGAIYLELECFRAALTDYEHYLQLRPTADDAEAVSGKVAELRRLAARLN